MKLRNIEVAIFPCNKDKTPQTENGFRDAEMIDNNYLTYGIATGTGIKVDGEQFCNLLVVDVDPKNGGDLSFKRLFDKFPNCFNTFTVKTQGGGNHYYFYTTLGEGGNAYKDLSKSGYEGIDIKYSKGYIIGPNSIGMKGVYSIEKDVDIIKLPNELRSIVFKENVELNSALDGVIDFGSYELNQDEVKNGLIKNRSWDSNYNSRLGILTSMKAAGFELKDYLDIIQGSNSDKTAKDWASSWSSVKWSDKNSEIRNLLKTARVFLDKDTLSNKEADEKIKELSDNFIKVLGKEVLVYHKNNLSKFPMTKTAFFEILPKDAVGGTIVTKEPTAKGFKTSKRRTMDKWWAETDYYDKIDFLPGKDKVVIQGSDVVYNTWNGFKINPINGSVERFIDFLMTQICGNKKEACDFLISWMAQIIQQPSKRYSFVPYLLGKQGTGKSFLLEKIVLRLFEGYSSVLSSGFALKDFNSELESKLVGICDEGVFGGNPKEMAELKKLTGNDTISINKKGIEAKIYNNYMRLIVASNEMNHTIPVEQDNRRYVVFLTGGIKNNDKKYFGSLENWLIEENGINFIMEYLLNYNLGDFNSLSNTPIFFEELVGNIIKTTESKKDSVYNWIEYLKDNYDLNEDDLDEFCVQKDYGYLGKDLYSRYKTYINEMEPNLEIVGAGKFYHLCSSKFDKNWKRLGSDKKAKHWYFLG